MLNNNSDSIDNLIPKGLSKSWRIFIYVDVILLGLILLFLFSLYLTQPLVDVLVRNKLNISSVDSTEIITPNPQKLKKEVTKYKQKFLALTPVQPYIVVNTTYNRFKLYKKRKQIREGFCSTGSYTLLKSRDKREWIFHTPKGMYRVLGKVTNPVWRRPDWSFVEEGLPIPPPNHPSRWEAGVLGDYALSIGNGYLIHGTIYKRFLGMPVTHGCIRMNDEDLEAVFKTLEIGSKVYVY